jgi:hypothetical protein
VAVAVSAAPVAAPTPGAWAGPGAGVRALPGDWLAGVGVRAATGVPPALEELPGGVLVTAGAAWPGVLVAPAGAGTLAAGDAPVETPAAAVPAAPGGGVAEPGAGSAGPVVAGPGVAPPMALPATAEPAAAGVAPGASAVAVRVAPAGGVERAGLAVGVGVGSAGGTFTSATPLVDVAAAPAAGCGPGVVLGAGVGTTGVTWGSDSSASASSAVTTRPATIEVSGGWAGTVGGA